MRSVALVVIPLVALAGSSPSPSGGPARGFRLERASVRGHVEVSVVPQPPPASLSPYARRRYQPPQSPGEAGGAEDAFVYLEPVGPALPLPELAPTRILQRNRTIIPHVSMTHVGQLVEFPNQDDVYHNLFSLSPGNRFSLGRYAPGVTKTARFDTPGVVRLFCDIHAEMAGVILVVDTPYVTRVSSDGAYSLSNVADGDYRAIAWHPTAGADTVALSLHGGQTVIQNFSMRAER